MKKLLMIAALLLVMSPMASAYELDYSALDVTEPAEFNTRYDWWKNLSDTQKTVVRSARKKAREALIEQQAGAQTEITENRLFQRFQNNIKSEWTYPTDADKKASRVIYGKRDFGYRLRGDTKKFNHEMKKRYINNREDWSYLSKTEKEKLQAEFAEKRLNRGKEQRVTTGQAIRAMLEYRK